MMHECGTGTIEGMTYKPEFFGWIIVMRRDGPLVHISSRKRAQGKVRLHRA